VLLEGGFKRGGRIRVAECLRQIVPDKYPEAKRHPVLANGGLLRETNSGKYSTTSSLNKGSPFVRGPCQQGEILNHLFSE